MAKPTAKSTVSQMKDYIRANRLNKAPILLGMKRADLIAGLRKLGHYDSRHDGVAPKRKAPAPKKPKEPVRAIADRPAPAPAQAPARAPVDKKGDELMKKRLKIDLKKAGIKAIGSFLKDTGRVNSSGIGFLTKVAVVSDADMKDQIRIIKSKISKDLLDNLTVRFFTTGKDKFDILYSFRKDTVIYDSRGQAPAQAPARVPAPKKEQVDRIERAKLTREFQRDHKTSVWKVLTLKPTATREAVRTRGRELMRKHHPDKGGDKATFQRVQQAVNLLMDTFE